MYLFTSSLLFSWNTCENAQATAFARYGVYSPAWSFAVILMISVVVPCSPTDVLYIGETSSTSGQSLYVSGTFFLISMRVICKYEGNPGASFFLLFDRQSQKVHGFFIDFAALCQQDEIA